jgi:hypothetical protein
MYFVYIEGKKNEEGVRDCNNQETNSSLISRKIRSPPAISHSSAMPYNMVSERGGDSAITQCAVVLRQQGNGGLIRSESCRGD